MEVIIALGLTAIISILVMGLLIRLLTSSGASSHQTAAAILAHEVLETATAAGPPSWGFGSGDQTQWTGSRDLILPGDEKETQFQFQLEAVTLRDSPDDLGTVHQLKVTVWWWGDEPGYRTEQGRTSVDAIRTVYVRK